MKKHILICSALIGTALFRPAIAQETQSVQEGVKIRAMVINGQGNIGMGATEHLSQLTVKNSQWFVADGKVSVAPSSLDIVEGDANTFFKNQIGIGDWVVVGGDERRTVTEIHSGNRFKVDRPLNVSHSNVELKVMKAAFRVDSPFQAAHLLVSPDGNVGIGTRAPQRRLEVSGGSQFTGWFQILSYDLNNRKYLPNITVNDDGAIAMGNDAVSIDKGKISLNKDTVSVAGNQVGIGIANPHANFRMQVKGGGASQWKGAIAAGGNDSAVVLGELNGVPTIGAHSADLNAWQDLTVYSNLRLNGKLYLKPSSVNEEGYGQYPWILMNPSTGEVTRSSDERLKTDIQTIPDALGKILNLRGVSYRWNEEGLKQKTAHVEENMISASGTPEDNEKLWAQEKQKIREDNAGTFRGFIAQEVERIFPEWVKTGDQGYKTINMSELDSVLVEALKQQQGMIEQLKAENSAIKRVLCRDLPEENEVCHR